ncbi:MAG: DUF86 domain-containing protein [Lachnospiraceae bacterium]|nr:DUF86 domain-containing protein [Lachnospiraceae bacterium]
MINKNDINSILLGIKKYINDINKIIIDNKVTENMYKTNVLYRHSLHMCLFQIGEISKMVPEEFKKQHMEIPWAEMRGLRNVEAHDYDNLDLTAVWKTIEKDIPELNEKLSKILDNT